MRSKIETGHRTKEAIQSVADFCSYLHTKLSSEIIDKLNERVNILNERQEE